MITRHILKINIPPPPVDGSSLCHGAPLADAVHGPESTGDRRIVTLNIVEKSAIVSKEATTQTGRSSSVSIASMPSLALKNLFHQGP